MYDENDPRSKLAGTPAATGTVEEGIAEPETIVFNANLPQSESSENGQTWFARGQNFVVAYTQASGPVSLNWHDDYEHVILGPLDESWIEASVGADTVSLQGRGIIVVPPGESTAVLHRGEALVRMFPADSPAAANAVNVSTYKQPHSRVRRVSATWGKASKLRVHALADHPPTPGRFGTIFRTETLMINFLDDQNGPRDPEKLSPHHHDDFEQGSLTIQGQWQHHIRTSWTTKQSQWREDQHTEVSGPSLTIIPPPTIHTSQGVGDGKNIMIDLFSPPRADFDEQGWVLNAEEYGL